MDLSLSWAARQAPQRLALIAGPQSWTYRQLLEAAEPYRRALETRSPADSPLGLLGRRDTATLLLLYALLDRGTPTVLLHPLWTPEEIRRALMQAGAAGWWRSPDPDSTDQAARSSGIESPLYTPLAPGSYKSLAPGSEVDFEGSEKYLTPSTEPDFEASDKSLAPGPKAGSGRSDKSLAPSIGADAEAPDKSLAPGSEADSSAPDKSLAPGSVVVFTSGSGGQPKGVVLRARALLAAAQASAANLGWQEEDRWLLTMPLAHVGGLSIVTRCLAARRTVVLSQTQGFRPEAFVEEVERQRVTLVSLVPTMLFRLLRDLPAWRPSAPLRAILLGGAPASPQLLEAADRGLPVLTTYGLTEACSQVTTQRPGTVNRGSLGAGPPLPGVELRLVEEEIQIRGPTLCEGYLASSEIEPPWTEDGWLATGDLGEIDEAGNLHVRGRRQDRILSGGENVDPAEVEAVLRQHPAVAEACVFGLPDEEWGQVVCAALTVIEDPSLGGQDLADEDLLRFLAGRLASFKRPRRIATLESLPLLASDKVDRRATQAMALPLLRALSWC